MRKVNVIGVGMGKQHGINTFDIIFQNLFTKISRSIDKKIFPFHFDKT